MDGVEKVGQIDILGDKILGRTPENRRVAMFHPLVRETAIFAHRMLLSTAFVRANALITHGRLWRCACGE